MHISLSKSNVWRVFLDTPYRDAALNIRQAFRKGPPLVSQKTNQLAKKQHWPQIHNHYIKIGPRAAKLLTGLALCIPIVNIVIDFTIRHFSKKPMAADTTPQPQSNKTSLASLLQTNLNNPITHHSPLPQPAPINPSNTLQVNPNTHTTTKPHTPMPPTPAPLFVPFPADSQKNPYVQRLKEILIREGVSPEGLDLTYIIENDKMLLTIKTKTKEIVIPLNHSYQNQTYPDQLNPHYLYKFCGETIDEVYREFIQPLWLTEDNLKDKINTDLFVPLQTTLNLLKFDKSTELSYMLLDNTLIISVQIPNQGPIIVKRNLPITDNLKDVLTAIKSKLLVHHLDVTNDKKSEFWRVQDSQYDQAEENRTITDTIIPESLRILKLLGYQEATISCLGFKPDPSFGVLGKRDDEKIGYQFSVQRTPQEKPQIVTVWIYHPYRLPQPNCLLPTRKFIQDLMGNII